MPRFGNEGRDGRSERSTGAGSDGTEDVASGVSNNTRQMSFRGGRPEPCFDRALISERQRGGGLMAFHLTRGDTRPILIGLAIVALLGWGLFIYAELHGAAQNQKARQQISRLSTSEESFKTQLGRVCKVGLDRGNTGLSPVGHRTRLAEEPSNGLRSWTTAGPLQRSSSLQTRPSPAATSLGVP